MSLKRIIVFGMLLLAIGRMYAQVQPHDTVPIFLADSINAVYIYADTGTALNRIDREGKKQGLWEKRYPDGHLRYRGHFINNRPYGVFKNYYDTIDSIQSIRVFSEDGQVAYTHMFYTTGALLSEGKYVNQKKDSIWKFYDAMQRMILKYQYDKGKRDGKSVVFYPDGNTLEIKNWKNDLEEGPFQQYFDEGGVKEEGIYVHGKLEDTLTVYEPDGTISIKGKYVGDMKEGNWIYYYQGEPKDTLIFHKGRCLNQQKFVPTKKQEDSLKIHYQELQQQLDHPNENPNPQYQVPDAGE